MAKNINLANTRRLLFSILRPESGFFTVAIVYGLAIGLLTLAVPIAVQTLINTIINVASVRSIIILSGVLAFTLFLSGLFAAMRIRAMEFYERRVYARLSSEFSLKTILAQHSVFDGNRNIYITQRYFDIMILQKNLPSLMIDGFAVVLQILVGFTLVSFYHEMLLAFNLVLLGLILLIWKLWANHAKRSAILLSQSKYDTAKWLNEIASAHGFFKSAIHMDYAAKRTEEHIAEYISNHKKHFKHTFSQTLSFLFLYALASSALLGIGGYLVVHGQLSIGQLVAAELIMSAVFFSMSRFSQYMKLYYELYGAAEKIGSVLSMPQEEHISGLNKPNSSFLSFKGVELESFNQKIRLDVDIPAGAKVHIFTEKYWVQKKLVALLKRYEKPKSGWVLLGEMSMYDYDLYELRQSIWMVDRSLIVECTIEEYLRMASPYSTDAKLREALEKVELIESVERLEKGIKTTLSPTSAPLQPLELLLLKLAAAFLAKPSVVVINQHFDAIPKSLRMRLLRKLHDYKFTVLYFSNISMPDILDATLNIDDEATLISHSAGASNNE